MTWLELRAALLAQGWRDSADGAGVWRSTTEDGLKVMDRVGSMFSGRISVEFGTRARWFFRSADEAARFLGVVAEREVRT